MSTTRFALPEVELLKGLHAAERKLLVLIASLPPLIPGITDKYDLARFAYEDATHAEALRQRIAQMRGGGRREPRLDPALDAVFEAALRAPSPAALVLGIFDVLKSDVVRTYRAYLAGTHPLGDLPSRALVESALAQDEEQIAAGRRLAERLGDSETDRVWAAMLRARLHAAGGVDGSLEGPDPKDEDRPEQRPFAYPLLPNWGDHPLRLRLVGNDPASDLLPFCWEGDLRVARVGMYEWLFHEADVLDYLPPMFHPTQGLPFEFHFDLARHLWDEARHSEGGYRGLRRLGFDPLTSEHPVSLRMSFSGLDPCELYTVMTQTYEAGGFPVKAKLIEELDTLGDADLSTFLRHDRADETMHVSYGHKWIPTLAEHFGHDGTIAEVHRKAMESLRRSWDEATAACTIERTLPVPHRMSYNRVCARYGLPPKPVVTASA